MRVLTQALAYNTGLNAPSEADKRAELQTSLEDPRRGGQRGRSVLDVVSEAMDTMMRATGEEEMEAGEREAAGGRGVWVRVMQAVPRGVCAVQRIALP